MRHWQLEPSQSSTAGMPAKLNLSQLRRHARGKDWDEQWCRPLLFTFNWTVSQAWPVATSQVHRLANIWLQKQLTFEVKSTTLLGVNNPMKVINKSEFQTHKLGNVCIQQVTWCFFHFFLVEQERKNKKVTDIYQQWFSPMTFRNFSNH